MPQPPALSAAQRHEGYLRSLEVRRARAALRAELKEGLPFTAAWHRPEAQTMKVVDLLMALPGVGLYKARKLMERAKIPPKNTVRACGAGQAARLFKLV